MGVVGMGLLLAPINSSFCPLFVYVIVLIISDVRVGKYNRNYELVLYNGGYYSANNGSID